MNARTSCVWVLSALVFLIVGGTTTSAMAQPAGGDSSQASARFDSLLRRFASLPGLEARFREERQSALLAVPLRSSGRIYYARPGRMLRQTETPEATTVLISEGHLRMRAGERTEVLSIDDNPVLRGFVDSMRAVLAGDRAALERYYQIHFTPASASSAPWSLRLVPTHAGLRRLLREIQITGRGIEIAEMTMLQVDGDRTRTEFLEVNPRRRFSASEVRRVFRVP